MTAKQFIIEKAKTNPALKGLETNLSQIELLNEYADFRVSEVLKDVAEEIYARAQSAKQETK